MKYYLVGIKGSGMSALAQCLKTMEYMVIGSDKKDYFFTEEALDKHKIPYFLFNKRNIDKYSSYTFIISYAYDETNNEEVQEIINKGYKYYYYSDFINLFFNNIKIGISGTHGKTTVCTMMKTLFNKESFSYIIGDGNGRGVKNSKYLIFEACEYKHHFIKYDYDYLVINNIEYDHPDYYNNIGEVINAFKKASKKAKCVVVNNDDKNTKKIKHSSRYTYGIENKSFVSGKILGFNKTGQKIKVTVKTNEFIFDLPFFGKHMVYNFLAAFTVYYLTHNQSLDKLNDEINNLIQTYTGPKRRQEKVKEINNNIIFDDYAHHPSEIESTYDSIKQRYQDYDVTIVFQPHTYSRTIFLSEEFSKVFENKKVYVMETFNSREAVDDLKEKVVSEVFKNCEKYNEDKIREILKKDKQIIIFMGAGNIDKEIRKYV